MFKARGLKGDEGRWGGAEEQWGSRGPLSPVGKPSRHKAVGDPHVVAPTPT